MDDVEDNLLADYDLSAWEVPPPAAGLADAVVRRARDPMPQAVSAPRSLTWWFVGAGSLAALVAVLALVMWGIERAPQDGGGVVASTGSRTLDLGRSSAAVDSGAQLSWERRGSKVAVTQSRGGATWRVSDEDRLVIDAAVASIEATGASLRVEVEMNRSDVRAMGVGSAAAVLVSLVTVIVYEGHVKATSNGQTVTIQPGASMKFGTEPPGPTPEQLNVGGHPEDAARIQALEEEVAKLKLELAARDKKTTASTACDAKALAKKGDDYLANGMDVAALIQFERSIACKPDPLLSKKMVIAACRSKNEAAAKKYIPDIPANLRAQYAQICLRFGIVLDTTAPPPKPACDADLAKKKGEDYLSNGMDTAALAQFEASLRCKYNDSVVKTAYLAACRTKQVAKARLYYAKLPPENSATYSQLCLRFGIDVVGAMGTLRINAYPAATIEVDGASVGTAPISMQATAGKHKVTFIVDGDKYTYPVTVKANEVTTLNKDFEANP